jgi:hypothetical protein
MYTMRAPGGAARPLLNCTMRREVGMNLRSGSGGEAPTGWQRHGLMKCVGAAELHDAPRGGHEPAQQQRWGGVHRLAEAWFDEMCDGC